MRDIQISIETFAEIWKQRMDGESSEDDILRRVLGLSNESGEDENIPKLLMDDDGAMLMTQELPPSKKWSELLVWTLERLGGRAHLSDIYKVSRMGRKSLGFQTTLRHDDSARECLESHCSESKKYRGKEDLFCMPLGKGAGIWALRTHA